MLPLRVDIFTTFTINLRCLLFLIEKRDIFDLISTHNLSKGIYRTSFYVLLKDAMSEYIFCGKNNLNKNLSISLSLKHKTYTNYYQLHHKILKYTCIK